MDVRILRQKALTDLQKFDEQMPYEYQSMLNGIKHLLQKAWSILDKEHATEREIAVAVHAIISCYQQKRDLLVDLSNIQEALEYRHRQSKSLVEVLREEGKQQQRVEAFESAKQRGQAIF